MRFKIPILGMLLFLSGICQAQRGTEEKPNFLFIFSDDQRYNLVHALGQSAGTNP